MNRLKSHRETLKRKERLRARYRAEKRFHYLSLSAVLVGLGALVLIGTSIFSHGVSAFYRTEISIEIDFDRETLGLSKRPHQREIGNADFYTLAVEGLFFLFPDVTERADRRELKQIISYGAAGVMKNELIQHPEFLGKRVLLWLPASSNFDQIHKGNAPRDIDESRRILTNNQLRWYEELNASHRIRQSFNWSFFVSGDSRYAELAGIGGAIAGSLFTLCVCLLLSFPLGVATAVYLEEFAAKNRWTNFIEVNINNLAAVPSIIFGLLGLGIILNIFAFPRGTPLVGGIVLALMTLPTIIISCRASLRAVPPSIRQAALAMGASPVQVVLHHVLPLALPGTLTGTIIGLAQALGETAPLLMVGMVAFIADVPSSFVDAATVLPVQIYLWAESAERGFVEKTSAAIMVILIFLIIMNLLAVFLRQKFERRW